MRKQWIILLLAVVFCCDVHAQDPHFSQYFASPVTLNPANTGAFNGTMRLAANYRSQWWGVGAPFNTATVSVEGLLLRNRIAEKNKLGFSLMALSDASSAGALKSNYLSAGLAYHLGLDEAGSNSFGLGFQAVYAAKRLDYSKLNFASQFMSGGFNMQIPSGEAFAGKSNYANFSVGALYQHQTETEKSYVGAAVFNFLDEKLAFNKFVGFQEDIKLRYALNGGYNKLLDNNNAYSFSANVMYQNGAYEGIVGGAYSWLLPGTHYEANYFTAGSWFRVGDAIIPYVSITYGDMQIGLSYDIITSGAKLNTPKNGSMELSFIFTARRSETGIKCPAY